MMNKHDNLFSNPIPQLNDWVFDEAVADVFNDMLHRSIPGYANIIAAVSRLVARFAQPNSQLYDLGCSLGNATLVMRRAVEGKQCNIIAIDNSAPMLARCKRNLAGYKSDTPVQLIEGNIQDLTIERASVVVSNFTLQFLPPEERQSVINKIYQGLQPNGIFILSEKFTLSDPLINNALFDLHYDFKRTNGYSELELGQKRTMLENVMLTDSIETHKQRLQQAGFKHIDTWFQCFNFGSLLAIKE